MRIDGGGYVTGVVSMGGKTYARSDISGFYKRNADGSWKQMLDFLKPSESNLMGVSGIAISPTDPNVVYAAAGQNSSDCGAVFKTTDGGGTWVKTADNLHFGSLMSGRTDGEPIAVSPYDGNTVFVLSKTDGLWKTENGGTDWKRVESFSPSADDTTGFVEFSNTNSQTIYVNISGEGMYKSEDSGASWVLTKDSPLNLRRCAQKSDGTLICSASDGIYSYSPDGVWSVIYTMGETESRFGFGGIDVDPFNDNHIAAITSNGADGKTGLGNNHIIESKDGGKTFTDRYEDHNALSGAVFVNQSIFENKFTSSSSIVFDSKNEGRAYISEWFGIFEINDIASSPMTIYRNSKGIENTVCYTVKAISSNIKAAAGFADINAVAWRSDDDMASVMGAASNIQDTTDIDYCASDSNIIARTGVRYVSADGAKHISVEYSTDGGVTWNVAAAPESETTVASHIAVASGKEDSGVPSILVSGSDGVYYSKDFGKTYTKSQNAPDISHKLYIYESPMAADKVLGRTFYICAGNGFFVSGNGGESFAKYPANGLPTVLGTVQTETSPYAAGTVLVTSKGEGVYLTTDYGTNFTKIGSFEKPHGATFGKGKNDGETAIYVYDASDETAGIYESDDMGQTWTKISARGNNFCGMTDIDADKNEYGMIYIGTVNRGVFCVKTDTAS